MVVLISNTEKKSEDREAEMYAQHEKTLLCFYRKAVVVSV